MFAYLMTWMQLRTDRRAVTAVEYGLIAGVMGALIVTAFGVLGGGLSTAFGKLILLF